MYVYAIPTNQFAVKLRRLCRARQLVYNSREDFPTANFSTYVFVSNAPMYAEQTPSNTSYICMTIPTAKLH